MSEVTEQQLEDMEALFVPGSRMSYALAADLGAPTAAPLGPARSSNGTCGTIGSALA